MTAGSGSPNDDASLLYILRVIGGYRWLIGGAAALSLGTALLVLVMVEPVYLARSMILVEPAREGRPDEAVAEVGIVNDSAAIESQAKILASRSMAHQVIERLGLVRDRELGDDGDLETAIRSFIDRVQVERDGRTNVIAVGFRSREPVKAARIANELASLYIADQLRAKHESTRRGTEWLSVQLEHARLRFEQAEAALHDYRAGIQPTYADAEVLHGIDIANLKRDHIAALADMAARRARLERVRRLVNTQSGVQAFEELGGSAVLQNLHALKNQTMRQEAELSTDFGVRHPRRLDLHNQITRLDLQIATEQQALVSRMQSELDEAVARERTLRRELDNLKDQTLAQREAETRMAELEREVEMARRLYEGYLGRFEAVVDTEETQRADARLISEAVPPLRPVAPDPVMVVSSALVAGIATALLLIYLLEQRDRGFRGGQHLEATIGLPCIAHVPVISGRATGGVPPQDYVVQQSRSRLAETMRGLIASLDLADRRQRARAVLLTSAVPDEGKSTLAACLARVAAQDGLRVLLIDADLRKPTLHELLETEAETGLQEILRGEKRVGEVLQHDAPTSLVLIPGKPRRDQPARLLGREGLGALIESARDDFDLILVDSAPLMAVADGRLISRMVDATLFVCRFDHTPRAIVTRCVEQLREAGAVLAGAVLTRVDPVRLARYGAAESRIHRRDVAAYYAD
ncbi:MAG: polysaccharide biosynthesis tyrosine autokinase [Geminicoccaceae bacterium]|nr:polysaccharide biosynthesis tyrosine autokinase [Geminicoccaceae bacterium]